MHGLSRNLGLISKVDIIRERHNIELRLFVFSICEGTEGLAAYLNSYAAYHSSYGSSMSRIFELVRAEAMVVLAHEGDTCMHA